jgi:predicted secreted acid phosphatase
MDRDYKTVMKFQNELERFGALSEIQNSMYQDESLDIIQKNIQEYNLKYGIIPNELLELLSIRPLNSQS